MNTIETNNKVRAKIKLNPQIHHLTHKLEEIKIEGGRQLRDLLLF